MVRYCKAMMFISIKDIILYYYTILSLTTKQDYDLWDSAQREVSNLTVFTSKKINKDACTFRKKTNSWLISVLLIRLYLRVCHNLEDIYIASVNKYASVK